MFTGIVEATAEILDRLDNPDVLQLTLSKPTNWELVIGQSISVDGACLTVVSFDDSSFTVELMQETLSKTTFGTVSKTSVNLERAMPANGRFEGHIVQGHVDAVGTITAVAPSDSTATYTVTYDNSYDHLVVEKGSITLDGISLTVWGIESGSCQVALIPHTLAMTTLGTKGVGDALHIEFDIIGKYYSKKS